MGRGSCRLAGDEGEILTDAVTSPSATFSVEELTALANVLGARRFPGIAAETVRASPQVDDAVRRVARRGLVARGVVVFDGAGRLVLAEGYQELVSTALGASIVASVERREEARRAKRQLYASPANAVEHDVVVGSIHRLTLFSPRDLAFRIVEAAGLEPRPMPTAAAPLRVPGRTVMTMLEAVRNDDHEAVRATVGTEGAAFAGALEKFRAWCRVQVFRRDTGVVGGDLRWIDTEDGLWRIESAEDADVVVSPFSAREIADEIIRHLAPAAADAT